MCHWAIYDSLMARIYLDNAATSFPKPEPVYRAVDDYQRRLGASVGRGAYAEGVEAAALVARCRKRAATLLGAERPERIVFTLNGTDSLNLALHGVLRPGDHVITSVLEHNSVARPLRWMEQRLNVSVTRLAPDGAGEIDPDAVRAALQPATRLVAITHASNVTGAVQPIHDIGKVARDAGVLFLVDAAQTAGQWPIDVSRTPVDLVACSGHKGLLGPLGTGLLYLRPGIETRVDSLRQGGTGTSSESDCEPESLPDKYEPGNHNAPGLAGLEAALTWLSERTVTAVQAHERELTTRLLAGLRGIQGLSRHGPDAGDQRTGVVSVTIENFDPHDVAAILDERFHVQVRSGLHCAPGAHAQIGTLASGGTVRLSVGPFTTTDDVDVAVAALAEIAASA